MAKAASKSKRVAGKKYEDPRTFEDVYGLKLATDRIEPHFSRGTILVLDKSLPCKQGDLVVVHPTKDRALKGEEPVVGFMYLNLPEGYDLPIKMAPGSEVSFCVMLSQTNPDRRIAMDLANVVAIHRVVRAAKPAEVRQDSKPQKKRA